MTSEVASTATVAPSASSATPTPSESTATATPSASTATPTPSESTATPTPSESTATPSAEDVDDASTGASGDAKCSSLAQKKSRRTISSGISVAHNFFESRSPKPSPRTSRAPSRVHTKRGSTAGKSQDLSKVDFEKLLSAAENSKENSKSASKQDDADESADAVPSEKAEREEQMPEDSSSPQKAVSRQTRTISAPMPAVSLTPPATSKPSTKRRGKSPKGATSSPSSPEQTPAFKSPEQPEQPPVFKTPTLTRKSSKKKKRSQRSSPRGGGRPSSPPPAGQRAARGGKPPYRSLTLPRSRSSSNSSERSRSSSPGPAAVPNRPGSPTYAAVLSSPTTSNNASPTSRARGGNPPQRELSPLPKTYSSTLPRRVNPPRTNTATGGAAPLPASPTYSQKAAASISPRYPTMPRSTQSPVFPRSRGPSSPGSKGGDASRSPLANAFQLPAYSGTPTNQRFSLSKLQSHPGIGPVSPGGRGVGSAPGTLTHGFSMRSLKLSMSMSGVDSPIRTDRMEKLFGKPPLPPKPDFPPPGKKVTQKVVEQLKRRAIREQVKKMQASARRTASNSKSSFLGLKRIKSNKHLIKLDERQRKDSRSGSGGRHGRRSSTPFAIAHDESGGQRKISALQGDGTADILRQKHSTKDLLGHDDDDSDGGNLSDASDASTMSSSSRTSSAYSFESPGAAGTPHRRSLSSLKASVTSRGRGASGGGGGAWSASPSPAQSKSRVKGRTPFGSLSLKRSVTHTGAVGAGSGSMRALVGMVNKRPPATGGRRSRANSRKNSATTEPLSFAAVAAAGSSAASSAPTPAMSMLPPESPLPLSTLPPMPKGAPPKLVEYLAIQRQKSMDEDEPSMSSTSTASESSVCELKEMPPLGSGTKEHSDGGGSHSASSDSSVSSGASSFSSTSSEQKTTGEGVVVDSAALPSVTMPTSLTPLKSLTPLSPYTSSTKGGVSSAHHPNPGAAASPQQAVPVSPSFPHVMPAGRAHSPPPGRSPNPRNKSLQFSRPPASSYPVAGAGGSGSRMRSASSETAQSNPKIATPGLTSASADFAPSNGRAVPARSASLTADTPAGQLLARLGPSEGAKAKAVALSPSLSMTVPSSRDRAAPSASLPRPSATPTHRGAAQRSPRNKKGGHRRAATMRNRTRPPPPPRAGLASLRNGGNPPTAAAGAAGPGQRALSPRSRRSRGGRPSGPPPSGKPPPAASSAYPSASPGLSRAISTPTSSLPNALSPAALQAAIAAGRASATLSRSKSQGSPPVTARKSPAPTGPKKADPKPPGTPNPKSESAEADGTKHARSRSSSATSNGAALAPVAEAAAGSPPSPAPEPDSTAAAA